MFARRKARATATLVATAALLVAALAVTAQAQASTLYACVKSKSGTAHVFTKKPKCKKGESKVSWNTAGPAGSTGPAGKNGTNGANGTNGTNGTDGTNGAVAGYAAVQSKGVAFTGIEGAKSSTLILSKSLPAGSYIVNGSVTVTAAQSGKNGEGKSALETYVDLDCTLTDTPTSGSAVSDTAYWAGLTNIPVIFIAIGNGSLSFNLPVTTTTASAVTISCANDLNNGSNTSPSSFTEEASGGVITAVETTHNS